MIKHDSAMIVHLMKTLITNTVDLQKGAVPIFTLCSKSVWSLRVRATKVLTKESLTSARQSNRAATL